MGLLKRSFKGLKPALLCQSLGGWCLLIYLHFKQECPAPPLHTSAGYL